MIINTECHKHVGQNNISMGCLTNYLRFLSIQISEQVSCEIALYCKMVKIYILEVLFMKLSKWFWPRHTTYL